MQTTNGKKEYDTKGYTVGAVMFIATVFVAAFAGGTCLLSLIFGIFVLYLTNLLEAICNLSDALSWLSLVRLIMWPVCVFPVIPISAISCVYSSIVTVKNIFTCNNILEKTKKLLWDIIQYCMCKTERMKNLRKDEMINVQLGTFYLMIAIVMFFDIIVSLVKENIYQKLHFDVYRSYACNSVYATINLRHGGVVAFL